MIRSLSRFATSSALVVAYLAGCSSSDVPSSGANAGAFSATAGASSGAGAASGGASSSAGATNFAGSGNSAGSAASGGASGGVASGGTSAGGSSLGGASSGGSSGGTSGGGVSAGGTSGGGVSAGGASGEPTANDGGAAPEPTGAVYALRCRLYTQGPARLDASATGYATIMDYNLMLTDETGGPRVVITDFGLARRYALDEISVTVTGEAVGTPLYMAPEQVVTGQKPITPATDVYALGNVMYEMVTGELPFKGSSITIMAVKRIREAVPSPRRLVPDLDTRWERAILRCLEREPAARFQAAGEVIEAITAPGPRPDPAPDPAPDDDSSGGFFRRVLRRK